MCVDPNLAEEKFWNVQQQRAARETEKLETALTENIQAITDLKWQIVNDCEPFDSIFVTGEEARLLRLCVLHSVWSTLHRSLELSDER